MGLIISRSVRACLAISVALVLAGPAAATDNETWRYGDSVTWRLDPPDGGTPSYIVGTLHLADDRLAPVIGRAMGLLHETRALVVERPMDRHSDAQFRLAMILSDGQELPDLIGDDLFARVVDVAEPYGWPVFVLRYLEPWALAMMLGTPADQIEQQPDGAAVFDYQLANWAKACGFPVVGLESVDEVVAAVSGFSEADHIAVLQATVDAQPFLSLTISEMIDSYVAGDLASLATMGRAFGDETGWAERWHAALVTERNRRMAKRLDSLLRTRSYLVAIGVLHLPGKHGVLSLMEGHGWTVTPAP